MVLICISLKLYAGQEATVRTGHGTTHWFQIGKGVHQSCILPPCLFNLYAVQAPRPNHRNRQGRPCMCVLISRKRNPISFPSFSECLLSKFNVLGAKSAFPPLALISDDSVPHRSLSNHTPFFLLFTCTDSCYRHPGGVP